MPSVPRQPSPSPFPYLAAYSAGGRRRKSLRARKVSDLKPGFPKRHQLTLADEPHLSFRALARVGSACSAHSSTNASVPSRYETSSSTSEPAVRDEPRRGGAFIPVIPFVEGK